MENTILDFIGLVADAVLVVFIVSPTVFGFMIWNKLGKKANPKIKMLEAADQEIVDGTNEALDSIISRLDTMEKTLEDISNERTEVKGFTRK
jgi:predicted transcriptional regulator